MKKIMIRAAILFLGVHCFVHASMEDEVGEKAMAALAIKDEEPTQEELAKVTQYARAYQITPLEAAIRLAHLPSVRYAVRQNPSLLNPENQSEPMVFPPFLHSVTCSMEPDIADFLLESGADINETARCIGLEVAPLVRVARRALDTTGKTRDAWVALFKKMLECGAQTVTESGASILDIVERNVKIVGTEDAKALWETTIKNYLIQAGAKRSDGFGGCV